MIWWIVGVLGCLALLSMARAFYWWNWDSVLYWWQGWLLFVAALCIAVGHFL